MKIIRGHDIRDAGGDDDIDDDDTTTASGGTGSNTTAAVVTTKKTQNGTAAGDTRSKDAMSVFGSFECRGTADTATQSTNAQAVAANYFSTGIAAQNLARGLGGAAAADQLRKCFRTVKDVAGGVSDADRPAYLKKGIDACSEAGKMPKM